jgi:hypothetical protein
VSISGDDRIMAGGNVKSANSLSDVQKVKAIIGHGRHLMCMNFAKI